MQETDRLKASRNAASSVIPGKGRDSLRSSFEVFRKRKYLVLASGGVNTHKAAFLAHKPFVSVVNLVMKFQIFVFDTVPVATALAIKALLRLEIQKDSNVNVGASHTPYL